MSRLKTEKSGVIANFNKVNTLKITFVEQGLQKIENSTQYAKCSCGMN